MSSTESSRVKAAAPDHPIHELIARRWSPYAFSDRPVAVEDLRSVFEAARWAPSSLNEQPWSYIVATKEQPEQFEALLSCLVEANQQWAKAAPVLALGVAALEFKRNARPNRVALHDLGLAAGNLCLEATARGLMVHQMAGIQPERARELYGIPENAEAVTALAIGYLAPPEGLPEKLRDRELAPRQRKRLAEFVFGGSWGSPSELVR
jgi:nitroreductase